MNSSNALRLCVATIESAKSAKLRLARRRLPRAAVVTFTAALAFACTEPVDVLEPTASVDPGRPAAAKLALPSDAAVLLTTAVKNEPVDAQSIREIREIGAYFQQNPIGASGPLELEIRLELGGITEPCWLLRIREGAWLDGGDGFKLDVSGANDLPAVIQLLRVVNGQAQDLTNQLESASGKLRFLADAKTWSLTLELAGIVTPSDLAAGHEVIGAVDGSLTVGQVLLPAVIREAEAFFGGEVLQLKIESVVEHLDGGGIRDRVESAYLFAGFDPVDANGDPLDMLIRYDLNPFGQTLPFYLRIIPREAWLDGGDFFELEASGPNLAGAFRIVKGANGQVTEDLTELIESVEARLRFDAEAKAWLLSIELTSNEVIAPMFHPMLAAHTVALGDGGSEVSADIREGEVRLF